MTVRVDDSEVRRLSADLGRVPSRVVPAVDQVMKRGAQNVKEAMAEDASGHATFPHFPRSISYDREPSPRGVSYEIGPDKQRTQGALGNILYFGTSDTGPVLDIEVGIRAEAPRLESHLADVSVRVLGL